jgi:preprotein translocase subunit YajC
MLQTINFLLAADKAQNPASSMIMFAVLIGLFYFMMIRPEQKRRKKMLETRSALKKGDTIVAMGVVAKVHEVKDKTVVLEHVDGSQTEMLKASVSEIQKD